MALELISITKKYEEKTVFDGFSYSFPEKGIFAILGNSGSGKTTLLKIISGIDKNYDGEVRGIEHSDVSVAFQEYRLFPSINVLENVTEIAFDSPTDEQRNFAKDTLHKLGFSEKELRLFPNELSGGMKQRVSFCRAVCKKSHVLLLDEATKELDEENVSIMLDMIKAEGEKKLVLFVTHKPHEAEYLGATVIDISAVQSKN